MLKLFLARHNLNSPYIGKYDKFDLLRRHLKLLNSFTLGSIHEQVEHAYEPDTHAIATTDGLPRLFQLLLQSAVVRYRCDERWLFLQAYLSRDKFRDTGPTERLK